MNLYNLPLTALFLVLLSCSTSQFNIEEYEGVPRPSSSSNTGLGTVEFLNASGYYACVHEKSFSGQALTDTFSTGETRSVQVAANINVGIGATFSIRYCSLIASNIELANGNVWACGIDPDMQISLDIKADTIYPKKILQPANLEIQETFMKIQNTSGMPIELNYYAQSFIPEGNDNELYVSASKTGVYRIGAREIKGYSVKQGLNNLYEVPEFVAEKGYIYNFEFDGNEVAQKETQSIIAP